MKYEYGVEYANEGANPELNDDVVVEVYSLADAKWNKGKQGDWNWRARTITKFRIVDERYKPKAEDNTWFECGELPPVGVECEYYDCDGWQKCKILATDSKDRLVVELFNDKTIAHGNDNDCYTFRPLKINREKTIDAAKELIKSFDIPPAVYGALYDAGLLRLPEGK